MLGVLVTLGGMTQGYAENGDYGMDRNTLPPDGANGQKDDVARQTAYNRALAEAIVRARAVQPGNDRALDPVPIDPNDPLPPSDRDPPPPDPRGKPWTPPVDVASPSEENPKN